MALHDEILTKLSIVLQNMGLSSDTAHRLVSAMDEEHDKIIDETLSKSLS